MYLKKLAAINTFIFDVDGVYTDGGVLVTDSGEFYRNVNIKDGYATSLAAKQGLRIVIISGGSSEGIRLRFRRLGVTEVYLGVDDKLKVFEQLIRESGLDPAHTLYMGDDMPDVPVLKRVALACCPADAVAEVKSVCEYISPFGGGTGCVRDVLEKALKIKGLWT